MRVPIPVVILLIIAVVGGVWWNGTRHRDFLTPPDESQLAKVRARVESSFPLAEQIDDAISEPVTAPEPEKPVFVEPPKPSIDLGDLAGAPELAQYAGQSTEGAVYLTELAKTLEDLGQFQRALLAWERVLDLTKPDGDQAQAAISAIRRLRPTLPDWTMDERKAIHITLHAGTGKSMAKTLTPVLEQTARDLEKASAGILRITAKVAAGKSDLTTNGPPPIALWMAGSLKDSGSTEVLSFTADSPDTLQQEVLRTIFQLVRGHITQTTSYTTPAALAEQEDPLEALGYRFTRLCWSEFGTALNLPPEKSEPPPKKP